MIGVLLASARLQASLLRRTPADLSALFTVPIFTLALLSITKYAGRMDLAPHAVVGSSVIAVWSMALHTSGDIIDSDRHNGTLEAAMATPAPLPLIVLGRIATVTLLSLFSLVESAVVARIGFGVAVHLGHVWLFAATLTATAVAMVCTATALAGLFVLARSARLFQNSLSYPFYLLSGAVVPATLLPGWIQPATKIVFLSWSTDLVRDCLKATPVVNALPRLGAITALGITAYAVGLTILGLILRRVRATGTVSHA